MYVAFFVEFLRCRCC